MLVTEQHRMASPVTIFGHYDRGAALLALGHDPVDHDRIDPWLVTEQDNDRIRVRPESRHPGRERCSLPFGIPLVRDEAHRLATKRVADVVTASADHDDHLIERGLQRPPHHMPDDGNAVQLQQLLRTPKPPRHPGREDDPRDAAHRVSPRIEPLASRSIPPSRPYRIAIISPRMEIAISSGVLPPMLSPIGPCRRARSSSDTPDARSRSRRSAFVFRLPTVPIYRASVSSAPRIAGSSNFGSCDRIAIHVFLPIFNSWYALSGHAWMIRSTLGNRSRVASAFRASTTVTRKPRSCA